MTRIDQLRQFIAEDPSDPFPRYALALEYLHDTPALAWQQFQELLRVFPDYLPTYYPAAHLCMETGEQEMAERLFLAGIEKAIAQSNRKTEMELRQAYNQWMSERD